MASTHSTQHQPDGFVARNPGIISAIFATAVAVGFVALLIAGANSHHGPPKVGHTPGSAPSAHAPAH